MALPLTKAQDLHERWARRLNDPADPLDEFTLHRISLEARRALPDSDRAGCGILWLIIGNAERELGRASEAVDAHRNAVLCLPGSVDARLTLSVSLGRAERHEEALAELKAALPSAKIPINQTIAWINISWALANLGRLDEALDAYGDALRVVPTTDADLLIKVAMLAAALDLHGDAVELIARYLCAAQGVDRAHDEPALAVIDRAPADHVARLAKVGALGVALDAARAEAADNTPPPEDMAIRTETVLSPEAWARFAELAGLPRSTGASA